MVTEHNIVYYQKDGIARWAGFCGERLPLADQFLDSTAPSRSSVSSVNLETQVSSAPNQAHSSSSLSLPEIVSTSFAYGSSLPLARSSSARAAVLASSRYCCSVSVAEPAAAMAAVGLAGSIDFAWIEGRGAGRAVGGGPSAAVTTSGCGLWSRPPVGVAGAGRCQRAAAPAAAAEASPSRGRSQPGMGEMGAELSIRAGVRGRSGHEGGEKVWPVFVSSQHRLICDVDLQSQRKRENLGKTLAAASQAGNLLARSKFRGMHRQQLGPQMSKRCNSGL